MAKPCELRPNALPNSVNSDTVMSERLNQLRQRLPLPTVFTGRSLVCISQQWRVEIGEQISQDYANRTSRSTFWVKVSEKLDDGTYQPGHEEVFAMDDIGALAEEIDRFITHAVGYSPREA